MKKILFALAIFGFASVSGQVTKTTTVVTAPVQTHTEIKTVPNQERVIITEPVRTETTIKKVPGQNAVVTKKKVIVKKRVAYRRNGSRHVVKKTVIKPAATIETKISAE
ncbi:hypothetical protein [Flavobacterium sp.]|uniref:hypothetical protein n=1 Tax=Flavobacterium sp. TaxID=239 RepID=UPI00286D1359|nr:hypothetical protein [Flavobacterium sp.]